VPFTLVHAEKYRTEDTNDIHKLNKLRKANTKYSKTKLPRFISRLLRHSERKRGGLILQCSQGH